MNDPCRPSLSCSNVLYESYRLLFGGRKGTMVCCTIQLWQLYCATPAPDSPVPSAGKGRYYRPLQGRTAHGWMDWPPLICLLPDVFPLHLAPVIVLLLLPGLFPVGPQPPHPHFPSHHLSLPQPHSRRPDSGESRAVTLLRSSGRDEWMDG